MNAEPFSVHSIILAEDDDDDKDFFVDVVKSFSSRIKVDTVSNGLRLMELLTHYQPELLFLDLDMPYKNGLECLVEIRNNPRLQTLPIIVFSSTNRTSNIQTAFDMGAHLFLVKSSTFPEYAAALKAVLSLDWRYPEVIKNDYCSDGICTAFT